MASEDGEGRGGTVQRGARLEVEVEEDGDQAARILTTPRRGREYHGDGQVFFGSSWNRERSE